MQSAAAHSADSRFLLRWTGVALALLVFPYLALTALHPPGALYTGLLFSPSDAFSYLSDILHGHRGEWLFTEYFTYRPLRPLPVWEFYTVLGHLLPGPVTPLTQALAFHLVRLLLALLFAWQLWRLYRDALPGAVVRQIAFLFALFTAGVGVYLLLLPAPLRPGAPPFDLAYLESSAFYGLAYAPHFAAVLLLIVLYLRSLFQAIPGPLGWRPVVVAGLAAAALSAIHPEKIGVLTLTTLFYLAWLSACGRARGRAWLRAVVMVLPGLPYVLFSYALTAGDPQIAELIRQGRHPLPSDQRLLYYLLGFGLPALFALGGLPRVLQRFPRLPPGEILLWSFVAAGVVLIAVPWYVLDHRGEGLQLGLAGLAARNLVHEILPRLWRSRLFAAALRWRPGRFGRPRLRQLTLNAAVILSAPTVLAIAFASPRAGLADREELYLSRDDVAAVMWLQRHAGRDEVLAGAPESGQFVVAYGGIHVPFGRGGQTPHFAEEARALERFFAEPATVPAYLATRHVRWLYFGPRERRLAKFDPAALTYLEPVFTHGSTVIYRIAG